MTKREIRKSFSDKRKQIPDEALFIMNGKIIDRFRSLSLQGIQYLLSYYPIPERKEFDPAACEQLLQLENAHLNIYWPKLSEDEITMEALLKSTDTKLTKNKYDIEEPDSSTTIEPQLIDAVFVPLLAFDEKGYRVGYGKGYYDRFLSRCAQDVVKIGFSYFEAVDVIDDINQYDIPLSFCITPERVYEF